ncbi:hypothetical protein [Alloactinosynnema sp. L-07]|uniref:hypothetical protein n=1 Tax=Alloactinosynnema sp. L-07 TaxID=1653480 RepID=UPI0006B49233|nr:hypothetical protein [Alloactinosynnema sp. L-07]
MSRAELAEAVNAWLWETTGERFDLDARAVARWERGAVRWPGAYYRSALRQVLGALDDAALGFFTTASRPAIWAVDSFARPSTWDAASAVELAIALTQDDLMPPNRRSVLTNAVTVTGTALLAELEPFLRLVRAAGGSAHGSAFTVCELEGAEHLTANLRAWHSGNGALARSAVVAQLKAHISRLRGAPQGTPETVRAFRVGAELADIAASMAWDGGEHAPAQRYFILSAQLAHVAGDDALAAVALSSLARQCFDLGRPDDGLEVVQLAQYATRRCGTPRLRAALATREAWAYAQRGDVRAFTRTVALAEDHHGEGVYEGDSNLPTVRGLDAAELAGVIGARFRDLAQHDRRYVHAAQEHIGRALELRHPSKTRNRAFDMIGLARTHLISGDANEAAELIDQVLPLAESWASGRVGAKLRDFHRESAPYAVVPAMRNARDGIADLVGSQGRDHGKN